MGRDEPKIWRWQPGRSLRCASHAGCPLPDRFTDLHDGLHVRKVRDVAEKLLPMSIRRGLEILDRPEGEQSDDLVRLRTAAQRIDAAQDLDVLEPDRAPALFDQRH